MSVRTEGAQSPGGSTPVDVVALSSPPCEQRECPRHRHDSLMLIKMQMCCASWARQASGPTLLLLKQSGDPFSFAPLGGRDRGRQVTSLGERLLAHACTRTCTHALGTRSSYTQSHTALSRTRQGRRARSTAQPPARKSRCLVSSALETRCGPEDRGGSGKGPLGRASPERLGQSMSRRRLGGLMGVPRPRARGVLATRSRCSACGPRAVVVDVHSQGHAGIGAPCPSHLHRNGAASVLCPPRWGGVPRVLESGWGVGEKGEGVEKDKLPDIKTVMDENTAQGV